MRLYKYTNSVKQEINIVFKYFLRKDYIIKFFSKKEQEGIEILSKFDSPFFKIGEIVDLKIEDEKDCIILQIVPVEIIENQLIEYSIYIKDIIDKEENPLEEDDVNSILRTFSQKKIKYQIHFQQQGEKVSYSEMSSIDGKADFLLKLLYLLFGLYYRIEQIPVHRRVKKEIEKNLLKF